MTLGPIEMQVLMAEDEDEAGPQGAGDAGLLLESDTNGTAFLLLETGAFLVLEG